MKILFLDIDGVVNCATTTARFDGFFGIDPYMALLIDRIIQATGCQVVLSSAWRIEPNSYREVETRVCKLLDKTESFSNIRGNEIKKWLTEHPEVTCYAILDDNSDMLPEQMPNFFKTSWSTGITEDISKKVIAHLCENQ